MLVLSAFFSGSETALMSVNRYRLRHLAKKGHRGAAMVLELLKTPDRLIGLILLGNNFVNILASSIATVIALRLFGSSGIAIATAILTLLVLIFSEVTPKTLATLKPEKIAIIAAHVYAPMLKIFYPLVRSVTWIAQLVLRLFGVNQSVQAAEALSRDELRTVVHEAGTLIPPSHRDMLVNVLDLESIAVNDVMVPRNEIVGIDLDDPIEEIYKIISESVHGRLPVYRESIDKIQGVIYLRDLLDLRSHEAMTVEYLESKARTAYFILENTPLAAQLLNFQQEKRRMGLVVDEYGDILGMVTLEDILEEIVGDFNFNHPTNEDEFKIQEDGSTLVEGSAAIRDLQRNLKWEITTQGAKTVNGLVLEHTHNLPNVGDIVQIENRHIEIMSLDENTIKTVRIYTAKQNQENNEQPSSPS